jgi:hypothetical protein
MFGVQRAKEKRPTIANRALLFFSANPIKCAAAQLIEFTAENVNRILTYPHRLSSVTSAYPASPGGNRPDTSLPLRLPLDQSQPCGASKRFLRSVFVIIYNRKQLFTSQ